MHRNESKKGKVSRHNWTANQGAAVAWMRGCGNKRVANSGSLKAELLCLNGN